MSGFDENGDHKPGTNGDAEHVGTPLSAIQIACLPDGAEIVITWSGGNGPWRREILRDEYGVIRLKPVVPGAYFDEVFGWKGQKRCSHRITLAEAA